MRMSGHQVFVAASGIGRRWWANPLFGLIIVTAFGSIGLSSLWPELHGAWSNSYGAFSHGYLVLGLCILLTIKYWRQSTFLHIAPWWPAAALLAGLVAVLCLLEMMFINSARLALLPLLILSAAALVFGLRVAHVLYFPIAFLYLALPVWWLINEPLQSLTVAVAGFWVKATALPAYLEGNFVHVPDGTFEIASGCSGLNYLIAALSLSGFQALAYLGKWKNRLLLLFASAVAALVANWLRVYSLIVIGIETDMQHYLVRVDHLYYGWVLFMVSIVPVFLLGRRLECREEATTSAYLENSSIPVITGPIVPAALIAGLLLLLPQVAVLALPTSQNSTRVGPLPSVIGEWTQEPAQTTWAPEFPNAEVTRASFVAVSRRVEAYRANYGWQTAEARVVNPSSSFTGPDWQVIESAGRTIKLDGRSLKVQEYRGTLASHEYVVWAWYEIAGREAADKLGAKLLELRGLFAWRRDAAAMALMAECVPDCDAARASLEQVARAQAASLR